MSQVYSRFVKLAHSLIDKYGIDSIWNEKVYQIDPDNPYKKIPGVDVTHTVKTAYINKSQLGNFLNYKDSAIPEGDLFCLIANQNFNMKLSDTITRYGKTYQVTWIDEINPADTIVLSIVGLRQ